MTNEQINALDKILDGVGYHARQAVIAECEQRGDDAIWHKEMRDGYADDYIRLRKALESATSTKTGDEE